MPKMLVNVDAYNYLVANPEPNRPPIVRTGFRGEEVEVSDEEAKRGASTVTSQNYSLGGGRTVHRSEPALLDPAKAGDNASAAAVYTELRREQLQAELDSLPATGLTLTPDTTEAPDSDDSPRRPVRTGR